MDWQLGLEGRQVTGGERAVSQQSAPEWRVLIVEDEFLNALYLQDLVESLGFQVVGPVASGREAIERIRADLPDLVLMDVRLQGDMDGIETLRRIRAIREVPVIAVTGQSDSATRARVMAAGAAGYLVKPVTRGQLETALHQVRTA